MQAKGTEDLKFEQRWAGCQIWPRCNDRLGTVGLMTQRLLDHVYLTTLYLYTYYTLLPNHHQICVYSAALYISQPSDRVLPAQRARPGIPSLSPHAIREKAMLTCMGFPCSIQTLISYCDSVHSMVEFGFQTCGHGGVLMPTHIPLLTAMI